MCHSQQPKNNIYMYVSSSIGKKYIFAFPSSHLPIRRLPPNPSIKKSNVKCSRRIQKKKKNGIPNLHHPRRLHVQKVHGQPTRSSTPTLQHHAHPGPKANHNARIRLLGNSLRAPAADDGSLRRHPRVARRHLHCAGGDPLRGTPDHRHRGALPALAEAVGGGGW